MSSYLKCVEVQLRGGLKTVIGVWACGQRNPEFGYSSTLKNKLLLWVLFWVNGESSPEFESTTCAVILSRTVLCHAVVKDLCSAHFFYSCGHHAWLLLRQWRRRNILYFILELKICLVDWAAGCSSAEFCVAACSCCCLPSFTVASLQNWDDVVKFCASVAFVWNSGFQWEFTLKVILLIPICQKWE